MAPSDIPREDDNSYRFGRMGRHNIVIACMPKGKYGITSAASAVKDMMRSFTKIQLVLMVGIGGGALETCVLAALQDLQAIHQRCGHRITSTISQMVQANPRLKSYARPDPQTDILFDSSFVHPDDGRDYMESCIRYREHVVPRVKRDEVADTSSVHYGLIASADRLMKDATLRDRLAKSGGG
ncbi:hypothetical protein BJX62DRAFT_227744 [Aspergillus germanicus]